MSAATILKITIYGPHILEQYQKIEKLPFCKRKILNNMGENREAKIPSKPEKDTFTYNHLDYVEMNVMV